MGEEQLTPEGQEGLRKLVQAVAEALASGRTRQQVTGDLVEQGWEQEEATEFVQQVAAQVGEHRTSHAARAGSGIPSWAIWVGILVLANVLSYLFDWPFWIY